MCDYEGKHLVPDKWPDSNTFVNNTRRNLQRQSLAFLAQKFEAWL
jgi:hypothetical protein